MCCGHRFQAFYIQSDLHHPSFDLSPADRTSELSALKWSETNVLLPYSHVKASQRADGQSARSFWPFLLVAVVFDTKSGVKVPQCCSLFIAASSSDSPIPPEFRHIPQSNQFWALWASTVAALKPYWPADAQAA